MTKSLVREIDVVGIGFGPANLSVSIAMEEVDEGRRPSRMFFDKKEEFSWHGGMLIDKATMQISFLKDLVTQRNPSSSYSFLSYLKARGRLSEFINLRDFFPTRIEFSDYLKWCAERLGARVKYGYSVVSVEPVISAGGQIDLLKVITVDALGNEGAVLARSISCAMGLAPMLPRGISSGPAIWHTSDLIPKAAKLNREAIYRFAVVGSGQSAAEAIAFLLDKFPSCVVHSIISGYGMEPADDTPFVNLLFGQDAVSRHYEMPQQMRDYVTDRHANTNYGVVDVELILDLYRRYYDDLVAGRTRMVVENLCRLASIEEASDGGLKLCLSDMRGSAEREIGVDFVVCGTGYTQVSPDRLFSPALAEKLARDASGRPILRKDHRVLGDPRLRAAIFLQSDCESSHGLSATLLSVLASRSGDIVDSLLRHLKSEEGMVADARG